MNQEQEKFYEDSSLRSRACQGWMCWIGFLSLRRPHDSPWTLYLVNQPFPLHSGEGGGGAHAFTASSRSHWPFWCGTLGSGPTLSLSRGLVPPLSLSLAWALPPPPLSLSLSLSCECAGLAPPPPPLLTWALLPHPCLAQQVPYHFLLATRSLVTPPHAPKASCVCLIGVSSSFCVMSWCRNFRTQFNFVTVKPRK